MGHKNKTLIVIAAVAVMLVGGATAALATNYSFEGDAPDTASCGGIHPWHPWQGTLFIGDSTYFYGYWGNDTDNWIYGPAYCVDVVNGCYGVSSDSAFWAYDDDTVGHWSGIFCLAFCPPPPDSSPRDTALGKWRYDTIRTCRDSFWGDFAGD